MAIIILLIIAFWFLPLPVALQVLMTIFGSLSVLYSIIKICVNVYNKRHQPRRTGYGLLDKFLDK
jgi:Sec-independent protein secretion pathway component TatC